MDIVLPDEAWEGVEAGTEGLLDQWLVAVGDSVAKGQVVASAVLVKATYEVLAPADGVVSSIDVAAEQNFRRGQVLARLSTA